MRGPGKERGEGIEERKIVKDRRLSNFASQSIAFCVSVLICTLCLSISLLQVDQDFTLKTLSLLVLIRK